MGCSSKGDDSLTRSEAEVLALVDSGMSNREIAERLAISVGTVKCHLHRAYEKLQARNRIEATVKAREDGQLQAFVIAERVQRNVTLDR